MWFFFEDQLHLLLLLFIYLSYSIYVWLYTIIQNHVHPRYARMNKNWIRWLKRIHSYMNSYDLLRTKRKKEKKKEILLHALSDL